MQHSQRRFTAAIVTTSSVAVGCKRNDGEEDEGVQGRMKESLRSRRRRKPRDSVEGDKAACCGRSIARLSAGAEKGEEEGEGEGEEVKHLFGNVLLW
mgnify:CR=1 FL=1